MLLIYSWKGATFNNLLDALDGSYCTFEGGDDPSSGIDGIYPDPLPGGYKGEYICIVSLAKHLTKLSQLKIAEQLSRHTSSHHLMPITRQSSLHSTPRDNALSMLRYVDNSIIMFPLPGRTGCLPICFAARAYGCYGLVFFGGWRCGRQ